jgi:hypothetical protein
MLTFSRKNSLRLMCNNGEGKVTKKLICYLEGGLKVEVAMMHQILMNSFKNGTKFDVINTYQIVVKNLIRR